MIIFHCFLVEFSLPKLTVSPEKVCCKNTCFLLFLFQPSQVGCLFTFLARQMAKNDNNIVVNRLLFEQVHSFIYFWVAHSVSNRWSSIDPSMDGDTIKTCTHRIDRNFVHSFKNCFVKKSQVQTTCATDCTF